MTKIPLFLLVLLAGFNPVQNAGADRGRAHVNPQDTTIVADNGSLLRGPFVSTEQGNLPSRERLQAIKDFGCNAVHCYAECASIGYPAGTQAAALDKLVQWTREDGLYLIITIGNCEEPINTNFNAAFWNFYAGRYAHEPHVIYEIQNEPARAPGVEPGILDMEKRAYQIIHSKAPDTAVLFFSYVAFDNGHKVVNDIKDLGPEVDWHTAAVSFHGYGPGGRDACKRCLDYVLKAGFPCFQTEFYSWPWGTGSHSFLSSRSRYQDVNETGDFERSGVSWLTFMSIFQVTENDRFKDCLLNAGIQWKSDFAGWPSTPRSTSGNQGEPWLVTASSGPVHIDAVNYDEGDPGVAYHLSSSTNDPALRVPDQAAKLSGASRSLDLETSNWVEYTVYIQDAGRYHVKLQVASTAVTNACQVIFGGGEVADTCSFGGNVAEQPWQTIDKTFDLIPGQQILRIGSGDGNFKLQSIELCPFESGCLVDGTYKIISADTGEALENPQNVVTNGTRVDQDGYHGWKKQMWTVRHLGANEYDIINLRTKKSLDVKDADRRNGTRIIAWSPAGSPNQHWIITPTNQGYYTIIAAHSGLCVQEQPQGETNAAPICQWEHNGSPRQMWAFKSP